MNSHLLYSEDFDDPTLDQKAVIGEVKPIQCMTEVI